MGLEVVVGFPEVEVRKRNTTYYTDVKTRAEG